MNRASGAPGIDREATSRAYVRRVSEAYGLTLLLTLVTVVVFASLPMGRGWTLLATSLAAATGVIGVFSSAVAPRRLRAALLLGAAAISISAAGALLESNALTAVATALLSVLLIAMQATILHRVVSAESVSTRTILGAITSYVMLGLLFAFAFAAIDILGDGPFFTAAGAAERGDFMFFSFTTLTTTGFGNLVPAGQAGESVAMLEMLTGQIFLVTLVAGLVSLWRPARSRQAGAAD